MRSERFIFLQHLIETSLNRLGAFVIPMILVLLSATVLLWQLVNYESQHGSALPIKVWEQTANDVSLPKSEIANRVDEQVPKAVFDTRLSTNAFWFTLSLPAGTEKAPLLLDFPSRHATSLACWDRQTEIMLGQANRLGANGRLYSSGAGYVLTSTPSNQVTNVLCRGTFRGPATISASAWDTYALSAAQETYRQTGTLIEAGIGVLAISMLITALVNRQWLYWAFVGWLLVNMRMAALSAGTDFTFFGYMLEPTALIESRKWTVCMYFSMTTALFSLLFKEELHKIQERYALTFIQLLAVAFPIACVFASFEALLVAVWVAVALGVAVGTYFLYRILRITRSRVAVWYSASIIATLLASLSEVVTASTGERLLAGGLNSVNAAIASALLVCAAVAEHMRAERLEKLEAQRTLKAAYEDSPIGLFSVTEGDIILKANPAFQKMVQNLTPTTFTRISDIFDVRLSDHIKRLGKSGNQSTEFQTKVHDSKRKTDRWFAVKASTSDGKIVEGSLQDITERFVATERLDYLANHDPLTDCLNLRGIGRQIARAARQPSALVYLDLDRFKLINDLYGHSAGDKVLKQVSERIKTAIGPKDLLSRVGGDEFVVAFADATVAEATTCCEQLMKLIAKEPYQIGRQRFALNVSGGLVGTERFGAAPLKEIMSAADTLCRVAKKRSTQRLIVMESDDSFFRHHKLELEVIAYLERGVAPEGLFLVMQPEISLSQPFDSLNFEMLLRMRKSDGSIIPAGIIIEAAEMHGKTAIIDRWVLTTAIAWLETHAQSLTNTRFVGINLSGGSLNDEAFTEELFALFERHPAALSLICIEITESVAITDIQNVQRFIGRVRALGAKVAIDDFGAGYSSFGYLKSLSVDALKLDGSLVKDASHSHAGLAIIEAIGGLVNSLGMKSIGEYAEDLVTIKALVDARIDYAQGYGISKPVLPERILEARSSVDFIEDPEILAYVTHLQTGENSNTMPLFESPSDGFFH